MSTATKATKNKEVSVVREGVKLIVPQGMSYPEAREALLRQEQSEEQPTSFSSELKCFPLDGVVALMRAIKEIYGFTEQKGRSSFFGESPPHTYEIPDGRGGLIPVMVGKFLPPKWEGGFIQTAAGEMSLSVGGIVKRKFEEEAKTIIQRTEELLKEQSIYKGRAITLDLSWIEREERFDPIKHAPSFMDVSNVDESQLILNDDVMATLNANPWLKIKWTKECKANGIPLKSGFLFAGKYGTGKTLAGRITAALAERNGWTFIHLLTASQLAKALILAEMYGPCVIYLEDVDEVTSGERDGQLNEIFNTLDGVGSKDKPVMAIFTTNNVDNIHAAMMRAGRIDKWIEFEAPDAKNAYKFVKVYGATKNGRSVMADISDEDAERIGQALHGVIPAFIADAVQTAKQIAMSRHGGDIVGKVTADDIVLAATAQRKQREKVERQKHLSLGDKALLTLQSMGDFIVERRKELPQLVLSNGNGEDNE